MKITSKIIMLIFFAGIVLLNTTCKQSLTKYVTYEGYVYDTIGGKPVQGIVVVLNACGGGSGDKQPYGCPYYQFEIGRSTTDASGHFYIHKNASTNPYYYPYCTAAKNFGIMNGILESDLSTPRWTQISIK